uniref:SFRICE041862.2 n=1 Tax=Spodoptera frugiperda TaxID=7108 RepID=A0A2H1V2Y3_SPOFR
MSPIRWLGMFVIIENICGVYRNYSSQIKIKKCLIIIQILVQNFVYALFIINVLFILLKKDSSLLTPANFIYWVFIAITQMGYLASVVYGITYSHYFASYYMSVTRVYESLKSHSELIYSFKTTRYWAGIVFNLCAFTCSGYRAVEIFHRYFVWNNVTAIPIIAVEISTKFTIVFEHFMLFIVVMTIVDLTKTLISLMVEAQQRVHRCGTSEVITGETINRWVELYQELVNCCDKVAVCFGGQDITEFFTISLYILIYIVIMLMPILATQMASHQWTKLQRVLARLHNSLIEDEDTAERKMIKDFLRVIKKHPLHIRFMSKVPVGIFLLPTIISVVVNQVIVLLQFTHVI